MQEKALEYATQEKPISESELFEITYQDSRNKFNKDLEKMIANVEKDNFDKNIIFLDKNHPPSALPGTMKFLQSKLSTKKFRFKVVCIAPLCKS